MKIKNTNKNITRRGEWNQDQLRKYKKVLAKKDDWEHRIKNLGGFRVGKIYPNGRVWCMLDTLFTSKTISQARDISKKRWEGEEL